MRVPGFLLLCASVVCSSPVVAAMPPVKISIQSAGMYAITYADLVQLGIEVSAIDPGRLSLRHRDRPVAIRITGEGNGSFDPGNRILFYAEGIHWEDEVFAETDIDVYWLEEGGAPGARMASASGAVDEVVPGGRWQITEYFEIDRLYDPGVGFPDDAPRLFWAGPVRASAEVSVQFTPSQRPDETQGAQIAVTLQGITDDPGISPDHRTQVLLNQCVLGPGQTWDGMIRFVQHETAPAGCLLDGTNTLTLRSLGTGANVDSVYLDSLAISYTQTHVARNNRHTFTGEAPATIGGFTSPAIEVYAITDPLAPRLLTGQTITGSGSDHQVSFADPQGGAAARYFVLAQSAYRTPAALARGAPAPALRTTGHEVDYIMVTHPDFMAAVQRLADHRRSQGLRVLVADVNDVYAEFSHGVSTARAIRDFFAHAYFEWQVRPSYVMLVGDASVSFKPTVLNAGTNYVPTHFNPAFDGAMVPSDNWFVAVDGDDPLPDMYIGRLPVTPESAAGTIEKIIAYDDGTGDSSWRRRAFFVADDEPGFRESAADLVSTLVPHYQITRYDLGRNPFMSDPRNAIRDNIEDGAVITTYIGHGTSSQWGTGMITSDDVVTYANRDRLTFLVALNCLNGYFVGPTSAANRLSLAEAFVTSSQGGAVAAWASSYLGFGADHHVMGKRLFAAIRGQDHRGLGAVTTQARIQALGDGAQGDTVDAFIFFGDPATVLASRGVVAADGGSGGGGIMDPILLAFTACALWLLRRRYHRSPNRQHRLVQ